MTSKHTEHATIAALIRADDERSTGGARRLLARNYWKTRRAHGRDAARRVMAHAAFIGFPLRKRENGRFT